MYVIGKKFVKIKMRSFEIGSCWILRDYRDYVFCYFLNIGANLWVVFFFQILYCNLLKLNKLEHQTMSAVTAGIKELIRKKKPQLIFSQGTIVSKSPRYLKRKEHCTQALHLGWARLPYFHYQYPPLNYVLLEQFAPFFFQKLFKHSKVHIF